MKKNYNDSRTRKGRNLRIFAIVGIFVPLLLLSVAYATLKTGFEIDGTAVVKSGLWNVKISSIGTPTMTGDASFSESPKLSGTTVSFALDLKKPGDAASFDIVISNTGAVDAELESLTLIGVDAATAQKVTYEVTPKNNVTVGSVLEKNVGEHVYTVSIEYSADAGSLPTQDISLDLGASINYVQK